MRKEIGAGSEKLWRNLIEVRRFSFTPNNMNEPGELVVVVPAWDPRQEVTIRLSGMSNAEFLEVLRQTGNNTGHLIADVNLGAESVKDLVVTNFRPGPAPIAESELTD